MKRIQVELHGDSLEALARLKTTLDAASDAEVLRRALQTVDQIVGLLEGGGRLLVERENQEVDVVMIVGGVGRR